MTTFAFGHGSKNNLTGLRPELIDVNNRALSYGLMDFAVVQGVRTLEQQKELYDQGRTKPGKIVTWTLKSYHLIQKDGYGHAYDICPYYKGALQWDDIEAFNYLATLHLRAALELNVQLEWGGHWPDEQRDRPHFQLLKGA